MADGKWQMADGKWQMAGIAPASDICHLSELFDYQAS
jgi:hypothetical protein